jgi:hypothetical protein
MMMKRFEALHRSRQLLDEAVILFERERIKREAIKQRRLNHQAKAA